MESEISTKPLFLSPGDTYIAFININFQPNLSCESFTPVSNHVHCETNIPRDCRPVDRRCAALML